MFANRPMHVINYLLVILFTCRLKHVTTSNYKFVYRPKYLDTFNVLGLFIKYNYSIYYDKKENKLFEE